MTIKICIGTKEGKTLQKELSEEQTEKLFGVKIGDKVSGNDIEFEGYEFEVSGGSDNSGTPMRKDVDGTSKKKILCVQGIGVHKKRSGQKQRKTVSGSVIGDRTSQVNLKILKEGKASLFEEPKTTESTEEESTEKESTEEKKEE